MPPLTMQEKGLTKGTSCSSQYPSSGTSYAGPADALEGSVAATRSRCHRLEAVPTFVHG